MNRLETARGRGAFVRGQWPGLRESAGRVTLLDTGANMKSVILSVIPGAASQQELQALVIVHGPAIPRVSIRSALGPSPITEVRSLVTSGKLQAELTRRRLQFYHLRLRGLPAGSSVDFEVHAGTETERLALRTLPNHIPEEGIGFIVASCYFDGFHHGAQLRAAMSQPVLGLRPAFQLWAGDNLYLDVPEFGWASAPYRDTVQRYIDYFVRSEYKHARGLHAAFSTYDDHEFWNNFPESQFWLGRSSGSDRADHIEAAQGCLKLFQASVNPDPVADGLSYRIELPPVSFFVADMRSCRTTHDATQPRMMTPGDLQALIEWAHTLRGPGALVLGQPLWIARGGYSDYNTSFFAAEYRAIWKALREAPYDVMVITGDVHHSRVLKFSFDEAPDCAVYEFCTSPASHIPTQASIAGFGHSQGRGKLNVPQSIEGAGQKVKAQCLFATTVPNGFGAIRMHPLAHGAVAVGGAFIDYVGQHAGQIHSTGPAPAEVVRGTPAWTAREYTQCHEPRMFTLRKR